MFATATGLVTALASGQAYAALSCTAANTITVGNNGTVADSMLTAGVCVSAADKLYGNFMFGNLPTEVMTFAFPGRVVLEAFTPKVLKAL
jgi:hypothetical protein